MARNGLAKDGPYIGALGYVLDKGKLQHRLVWKDCRGDIPDGYLVHHINGDKTDNRLENLELMSRADHCRHHSPRTGYRAPVKLVCASCGQPRGAAEMRSEPTRSKCNKCRGQDNQRRREARHASI